ncbi:MAG: flippase [Candidatus Pacebacteria bacterium]|nr:flippase [Candidatus Paceibacterota bacterium]
MSQNGLSFLFENKTASQTIAKNAAWLFLGTAVSRVARALVLMYAARLLGARDWGAFNYALSLAAFFTIFTDFGVNAVLTRESARDTSLQERYFSSAFFIKLIAGIGIALILIALFPLVAPHIISSTSDIPLVATLIPIIVLVVLFDSMRDFGAALSRAWEKMHIESIIQMLTNGLIVVCGIGALILAPTARSLSIGYAIGTGVGMIAAFIPFRRYFKTIIAYFSLSSIKKIIAASWPFGMMGLMGVIMLNTDSLMIGWFLNIEQVGYYGAGQRIAQLLYTIPSLIAIAFFPALSKRIHDPTSFSTLYASGVRMLLVIALPLTIGGVILAKPLITFLYGTAFAPSAQAFMLMNLTYIPVFISALLGNTLFALGREKKLLGYVACGVCGNALFNIIFIPLIGIAGAALSTVINQIIATSYLMVLMRDYARGFTISYWWKPLMATCGMGVIVFMGTLIHIPVLILCFIGALIYGLILMLLKDSAALHVLFIVKQLFQKNFQTKNNPGVL